MSGLSSARVRIGDTERDAAASALGDHFAAGRLTRDEFDERLELAWAAKSADDLDPLFVDLPSDRTPALGGRREPIGFRDRDRQRVGPRRVPSGRPPLFFFVVVAVLLTVLTQIPVILVVLGFLFLTGVIRSGGCRVMGRMQSR